MEISPQLNPFERLRRNAGIAARLVLYQMQHENEATPNHVPDVTKLVSDPQLPLDGGWDSEGNYYNL